jgi:hypothetical protein
LLSVFDVEYDKVKAALKQELREWTLLFVTYLRRGQLVVAKLIYWLYWVTQQHWVEWVVAWCPSGAVKLSRFNQRLQAHLLRAKLTMMTWRLTSISCPD